MAPGATLNVYVAADGSSDTFTDMYNHFVTDNNSQVMTTSWGLGESAYPDVNLTNEQIFMQAAAQGISMFAASGDYGASDCAPPPGYCPPGPNNADYPSSSAYITAANGTELSISDTSGAYGSEQASTHTGGAISALFDKPDWQQGPGVPADIDMRMNSDMALNYGSVHPYLILVNGPQGLGYYGIGGTSAVAPILSGLFAIGVSQQPGGASLGQSNSLIYNDVNAGNYASDFHDVASGCNGYLSDGTTPSCAGANWDHPTGWGSPKAKSLLSHLGVHGPAGTLTGTVTDAASGAPVAGATITVNTKGFSGSRTTKDDGGYTFALPVGSYTVSVVSFGYNNDSASIAISDGDATTQDFTLSAAPTATLSGKVSDGSGHGYGLYADVKVSTTGFGQVADVWTDPESGKYDIKLPKGITYTLKVAAAFDGYNTASKKVTLSGNKTQNFPLTVTTTCMAPGYRFKSGGFSEDFNGSAFPPAGWTVVPAASTVTWMPSSQEPDFDGNYTGGTGDAAEANYSSWNSGRPTYDTAFVTPSIPVTSLHGATTLRYKANYQYRFNDALDLDISTDAGASWTTIEHWDNSHGAYLAIPGVNVQVSLAQYLSASDDFKLRWRYYNLRSGFGRYAQIDDVAIGGCAPFPGALIFGQVSDENTGEGVVGAMVADEKGNTTTTMENPADPNLPVGTYGFFESAGKHTLTATYPNYHSDSASLNVINNKIATQNFVLKAGRFSATPNAFTLHVMVNNVATAALALKNTGSGNASFNIWLINAPPPVSTRATGPFAATPHYAEKKSLAALTAADLNGRSSRPVTPIRYTASHNAGDVVSRFSAGISIYGLGVDHDTSSLWLGSPNYPGLGGDGQDHQFLFDGTNTGGSIDVSDPDVLYMADMAFDDTTGTLWQLSVDGPKASTSHIIEFDPVTMMPTGNSILVPSPQSERGLAYDPLTNTWYAGDFNSNTVYHFNASGTLLDSVNVGLPITGLAYNLATRHLFVLTSNGAYTIYVIDVNHGYAQVGAFDIEDFDPANAGSGLGYDCDGNLWISDYTNKVVWQAASGESGWCSEKGGIPWLTLAPAGGSLAAGTPTSLKLTFDGTDQKEFTTSHAYLSVASNTPYPNIIVPLTVTWDPQPVNLSLTGEVSPSSVRKGATELYTLTVSNLHETNHGAASQVKLSYMLPDGVQYTAASGDATCTEPPSAGSSAIPAAGSAPSANTVLCDFSTISLGGSKTETLAVKVNAAGKLASTFDVSAREPESDGSDNNLTLTSEVIGTVDLALSANKTSIPTGGTGKLMLTLDNTGPDPAAQVQLYAKAQSGPVSLQSGTASQGSCTISQGAVACELGQVDAGDPVTVTLQLFGTSAGSATVNAQVITASDEPDDANNSVSTQIVVKAPPPSDNGGSGGGAFGWFALAALMGLALSGVWVKRRYIR